MRRLAPIDQSFLTEAPLLPRATLTVPHSWAEDLRLHPTGDGGTQLDYTIALDNQLLRFLPVPAWLQRRLDAITTP